MATAATDSYTGYVQDKLGACHRADRGLYRGTWAPTPQDEHQLLGDSGGAQGGLPHAPAPHGLKATCSHAPGAGGEGETESAGPGRGGGTRVSAHCFFSRVVMVTSCLAALAMS